MVLSIQLFKMDSRISMVNHQVLFCVGLKTPGCWANCQFAW